MKSKQLRILIDAAHRTQHDMIYFGRGEKDPLYVYLEEAIEAAYRTLEKMEESTNE